MEAAGSMVEAGWEEDSNLVEEDTEAELEAVASVFVG